MKRRVHDRVVAVVTLASFVAGMAPRPARAQSASSESAAATPPQEDRQVAPRSEPAEAAPARGPEMPAHRVELSAAPPDDAIPSDGDPLLHKEPARPAAPSSSPIEPDSLPTGAQTTGASSQVLSLPQGAGKIDGMGESFSNQLSTGTGSFSVPIALPGARGNADPALALAYSTSGGHGIAGVGWGVAVPFIARQTDRGSPGYQDPPNGTGWMPTQDRFVFNGGQELVPICLVSGGACATAQTGEAMPAWANGWQYFRPRIEGSFVRIFWSPDHRTWRVQSRSGESMEIGAPLDGTSATGTIEASPLAAGQIFRWNLSRQYDAYGAANVASGAPMPVNVTRYVYTVDGGVSYLTDVYDTPPQANAASASVSSYAHHARLLYAARPDVTTSYRRGWLTTQGLRLTGIDVTSAPFSGASTRKLVRRYHLAYDPGYHVSLLTSVQVEGRCGTPAGGEAGEPIAEDASGNLPASTSCSTLPAMTFGYTHVTPYRTDGSSGTADLVGYDGFDERVTMMVSSPPHSVDEAYTDLFDVNSDGLPDVLVTMPGLYGGKHGLYLNGSETGQPSTFSAGTMGVQGVLGEDTTTISLDDSNISSGDIDGDGIIDLIHMPQVKTYSVYTPQAQASGWVWQGREVTTAAAQSPKIDLGGDAVNVQRMDVNGDGLVDVVVSTGTELETFFSLDRYPGGDGQFGHAAWTGATTALISNDPIAACVPWDGLPVSFSDSTIKIADMNGDGLPDIVRMQQGSIHYWPGRGDGHWGTGAASACPAGAFGENQSFAMTASPEYADPNGSALRIDDVNGDGLDDAVEVNTTEVNVWLNVDGASWVGPHVIKNAPASPAFQSRVRTVDMNGSGTRDILWGDANAYRFMDLSGGARPWLLTHIANGLGKTTDLSFASSPSLMLAAAAAGSPWASATPMPIEVVTQMTVADHLPVAGSAAGSYVTQYSYRDPVYDGVQREFRGFTTATQRQAGDGNSPSSSVQSQFLLGACQDDEPLAGLPSACGFTGRWRDNPREALKGLPLSEQTFDDTGNYESTVHHTYRLRLLYPGLDGREVRHAFVSTTDTYLYDVWSGDRAVTTTPTSDVELELSPPPYSVAEYLSPVVQWSPQQAGTLTLHGSANTSLATLGRVHLQTSSQIDVFGNTYQNIDYGCVDGCVAPDDVITQYAQPSEVSGGDSAWLWRDTETTTQGSRETRGRNTEQQVFDTAGSPLYTYRYLQGTLALVRSRVGGGAVAPAPAKASKDQWITSLVETYDAFGNELTSTAPNQRCTSTAFDPAFAALPISNTIYAGAVVGSCGGTQLVTKATYDRGLGAVAALTNIQQASTTVEYDGFGRITAIYPPDPMTGAPGPLPSTVVAYQLPTDSVATPYTRVHTEVQDGADPSVASYRDSWGYIDGLGRTRVTLSQADVQAGDTTAYVASGLTTYDEKGEKNFVYLDFFYPGDAGAYGLSETPTAPYTRTQYDAFGRAWRTFALGGTLSLETHAHALAVDGLDAAQQPGKSHAGLFATSAKDGHGRSASVTERNRVAGVVQAYTTTTTFLSTGEPQVITRTNAATNASVVRWMTYDSLGRMLANVEPDTSTPFSANPAANIASIKSWRYAYNDDGDLVGTSDARGCGANYAYDASGRILGEDYSPCTADHPTYTAVSGTAGYEVAYAYDTPDTGAASLASTLGLSLSQPWFMGRVSSVTDRAGKVVDAYDARGRTIWGARRLASPSGAIAPRWYVRESTYDAADRLVNDTAGALDSGATTLAVASTVATTFSKRSLVASVESGAGAVVQRVVHDADTLPLEIVYGDAANTTTAFSYTVRRKPLTVQTYRAAPSIWPSPLSSYAPPPAYGGAPGTLQLLLEDLAFTYDEVDDPIAIADDRTPSEWPAGAQPVSRTFAYDDLYRLAQVGYGYGTAGSDPWTSPFAAEDAKIDPDPQRATPSPHVSFASRVAQQGYAYDWLGNMTSTSDDAGGFYDRSLGTITNGTATVGPYQLKSAKSTTGVSQGALTAAYDAAGNMSGLTLTRSGTCLPVGAICSTQYAYVWDEVGRLSRARRWDVTAPGTAGTVPTTKPAADLVYTYDATNDRAIKQATDGAGNVRYTLYPLDALEVRQTTWDAAAADYDRTPQNETGYVFEGGVRLGRIELAGAEPGDPTFVNGAGHLFLELPDHLGSTSVVIDEATGELVEATTYTPYGSTESDYRPARWGSFREDYRFTGKEEDVEVGLEYFGKRYLAPELGRWVSADPLTVHSIKADLNAYAYVKGAALKATDPVGLKDVVEQFGGDVVVQTTAPQFEAPMERRLSNQSRSSRPERRSRHRRPGRSTSDG